MTCLRALAFPVLLLLAVGCAASSKRAPEDVRHDEQLRTVTERVDRNAADIKSVQSELATLRTRVEALETELRTTSVAESARIEEIKENISFLSDQILKLDSSVGGNRPAPSAPVTGGAEVFKPNGFDVLKAYREALADYEARRFETAIGKFTEIVTVAPGSSLADNAHYWIGECWYDLKNYERAMAAFQKVLSFPNTNKAPDASLKIGMIYQLMNNPEAAREELKAVMDRYPGTPSAKIAGERLKELERK